MAESTQLPPAALRAARNLRATVAKVTRDGEIDTMARNMTLDVIPQGDRATPIIDAAVKAGMAETLSPGDHRMPHRIVGDAYAGAVHNAHRAATGRVTEDIAQLVRESIRTGGEIAEAAGRADVAQAFRIIGNFEPVKTKGK